MKTIVVVYRVTKTGAHKYVRVYTHDGENITRNYRAAGATYQQNTNTLRVKSTTDFKSLFGDSFVLLDQ